MRANARLVSYVVSSQTPLATGEVDIVIAGDEWLTALLTGDQPERTLTIPKQGGMR
jgi:spermidine/putrescine transport system substrate-binding protein